MHKPRAKIAFYVLMLATAVTGCSKGKTAQTPDGRIPEVEVFPISNSKFVNCRFATANPSYSFGAKIAPNVVRCDEGVPKRMELLSQNPLPTGLEIDTETLALVGTPKERVSNAAYVIYLENEAGYVKVPLTITVK